MKILAVDDDPVFLEILQIELAKLGHSEVTLEEDPRTALALVIDKPQDFDCFILDIQMPGLDGSELCERIRTLPEHRSTPILMISRMTQRADIERAFHAGANDYITKPIDAVELKIRLQQAEAFHQVSGAGAPSGHYNHHSRQFEFADPIDLGRISGFIEYHSCANLLSVLKKQRQAWTGSCIGVHVANAGEVYARTNCDRFADIMGDLALASFDVLKSQDMISTYAGRGDFCILLQRGLSGDLNVVMDDLGAHLKSYAEDCLVPYELDMRASLLHRRLPFHRQGPDDLLDRAVATARETKLKRRIGLRLVG